MRFAVATAQNAQDEVESLASHAMSLYTGVTSEVVSMYTELTSILAQSGSNTPASTSATATGSSSSSDPTSSASSTRPSSASSAKSTSSHSSSSFSSTIAAPSQTADPSSSKDGGPNVTAIVVGVVLGAVLLGLLILLALLCLRRRRRRRVRTETPTNDEVEGWRSQYGSGDNVPGVFTDIRATAGHDNSMAAAAVPAMSQRSMHNRHTNPFVPEPPPTRRTAPNSRPGLTDGPDTPYKSALLPGNAVHPAHRNGLMDDAAEEHHDHGFGKDIAIGAGGAALGAAAMKHHNNNKVDRKQSVELPTEKSPQAYRYSLQRKPVPNINTNAVEEPGAENPFGNRVSMDEAANAHEGSTLISPISPTGPPAELPTPPYDRPHMHERRNSDEPLLGTAGAAAAGAVGGAALAKHHDNKRNNRHSSGAHRDDSFKLEMPREGPPYQAYRPVPTEDISDNEQRYPNPPAAAVGAVRRSMTPPDIPTRSPKRMSFENGISGSSSDPSSESVDNAAANSGVAHEPMSDNIPVMWRRSAENPRSPSGITYHDFVPVKRDAGPSPRRQSGAGWNAGRGSTPSVGSGLGNSPTLGRNSYANLPSMQGKDSQSPFNGRRISLNDLIEDERRRQEESQRGRRAKYSSGGRPLQSWERDGYSGYGVGRAL